VLDLTCLPAQLNLGWHQQDGVALRIDHRKQRYYLLAAVNNLSYPSPYALSVLVLALRVLTVERGGRGVFSRPSRA
jgi:hypothetical protein